MHNAKIFTELTTNFLNHAVSSLGNAVHGQSGENKGKHTANQQTGQVYGMPNVYDNPTDLVYVEACINTEWLQKLNLSMPTTIDELYDVLVAFRDQDPNGNGKKDEVPLMGLTNTNGRGVDDYIINAFIQYSHNRYAMIDDDGKAFAHYTTDEYREALKFLNKLYDEGLINDTMWSITTSDFRSILNPEEGKPYTVGIACRDANL